MGQRGPGAKPTAGGGRFKLQYAKRRLRELERAEGEAPIECHGDVKKPWHKKGLNRAGRVIAFIESLKMTRDRWAGKRFKLLPEQKEWIKRIYATDRGGRRIVREALLTMARKGGKSELASALALCHLAGPEAVERGEVYAAACDRDQAGRIFENIVAFIEADPDLATRINIKRFDKSCEVTAGEGKGSYYKTLSSDATKGHALNPSFVVLDELAQWKGRELYDNIMTGFGGRDEPLSLVISTKSNNKNSVMHEVTKRARDQIKGIADDPTFCGILYEVPDDCEDIYDEAVWHLANPLLRHGIPTLESLRNYAAKAKRMPGLDLSFRRLMLNQSVDDEAGYIPLPEWRACNREIDRDSLRGQRCWGGLDLSSSRDLTSLALWFPEPAVLLSWSWLPEQGLEEKAAKDDRPYLLWRDAGWLETTQGAIVNRRAVALRLAELASVYDIQAVAYDTWRIEELLSILNEEGLDHLISIMRPFRQGFASMNAPMDRLEQMVLARQMVHEVNPVLEAAVDACRPEIDPAENRKPSKARAAGRIDPLVAALMAVGLWSVEPPEDDTTTPFRGMTGSLVSSRVKPLQRKGDGRAAAA